MPRAYLSCVRHPRALVGFGLLALVTSAPPAVAMKDGNHPMEATVAPAIEVSIVDGRLTLEPAGEPLVDVLNAIGEAGSFVVTVRGRLTEPVHETIAHEPLEDAIRRLVRPHSIIVIRARKSAAGEGMAGIAQIRVKARRDQKSARAAEKERALASPNVAAMPDAADPDANEPAAPEDARAYQEAVFAYVPPAKDDILLELLEPDTETRVAAVPRVGSVKPRQAVEVISHVFANQTDQVVRSRAIAALSRVDSPLAVPLLRERALNDEDPALRAQALNALATSSGHRITTVPGRALRLDPEPRVRLSAIRALERVGGSWARGYLERAAFDPDLQISTAAERALADWPDPAD